MPSLPLPSQASPYEFESHMLFCFGARDSRCVPGQQFVAWRTFTVLWTTVLCVNSSFMVQTLFMLSWRIVVPDSTCMARRPFFGGLDSSSVCRDNSGSDTNFNGQHSCVPAQTAFLVSSLCRRRALWTAPRKKVLKLAFLKWMLGSVSQAYIKLYACIINNSI